MARRPSAEPGAPMGPARAEPEVRLAAAPAGREGAPKPASRVGDTPAPRGGDVPAPRGGDVPAPRGGDVPAPRGGDAAAARGPAPKKPALFGDIRALARPEAARAAAPAPAAEAQRPPRPRLFAPRARAHQRADPVLPDAPAAPIPPAPPRVATAPAAPGDRRAEGPVAAPPADRAPVAHPAPQTAPARAVVAASGLGLTYRTGDGPVVALRDVTLSVAPGDFVSFIGPSGCGKTTLLRLIADLEQPTEGTLAVNGTTPQAARLARSYGYVFQAAGLLPWRTIEGNVRLPLQIMGYGRAEQRDRVARTLDLVGLTGFARKYPWQLSGGMQQRASIARALAFDADLLLMDEPFGALDEIVRDHLNGQLRDLWAATAKTVCFVTHSIPEAVYLSTRIVVMSPRPGRITDIIESPLPRDRPLEIRETPEFLAVAARVRAGLRAGSGDG